MCCLLNKESTGFTAFTITMDIGARNTHILFCGDWCRLLKVVINLLIL